MEYLIFSDVHGNLPALEKVLKLEKNISGYINLGDVVNYGPWSNECVQLLDSLENCYNILGNHDAYFNAGFCDVPSDLVQAFFKQTYESFNQKALTQQYVERCSFENFELVHTHGKKDYIFKDTKINIEQNTMLGHSHQQYIRLINDKLLLNPGSVGQNRACINVANYVIWNIETGAFQLKNAVYNLKHLIDKMEENKYPKACLDYYRNKKVLT